MIAFAAILPFISTSPDGLETLVESSADQKQTPVWNGLIADYSLAISSPYISTLIAGIFGTMIVLITGYAVGLGMKKQKRTNTTTKRL